MKNTIYTITNKIDAISSRLQKAEECISVLEDRVLEANRAEQMRYKQTLDNGKKNGDCQFLCSLEKSHNML